MGGQVIVFYTVSKGQDYGLKFFIGYPRIPNCTCFKAPLAPAPTGSSVNGLALTKASGNLQRTFSVFGEGERRVLHDEVLTEDRNERRVRTLPLLHETARREQLKVLRFCNVTSHCTQTGEGCVLDDRRGLVLSRPNHATPFTPCADILHNRIVANTYVATAARNSSTRTAEMLSHCTQTRMHAVMQENKSTYAVNTLHTLVHINGFPENSPRPASILSGCKTSECNCCRFSSRVFIAQWPVQGKVI